MTSSVPPTSFKTHLIEKFCDCNAIIGIVGMGYVGLPLALTYSEANFNVLGFDIDQRKIKAINNGESYIKHLGNDRVASARECERLKATSNFSEISRVDAIIVCVPTPLNKYREPDLSFIHSTMDSLLPYLRVGQVLSLESTTYPGTTEEVLLPLIVKRGFTIGSDFFLVYSPEREDPGNSKFSTASIPKVMGGCTSSCSEVGHALYDKAISEVVPVSSPRTAEMTKLLENIHRAVNIGLVNELKPLAERMGIDLYEVIKAASTKPFGFVPYYPGPGLGGHCIPIDPFYLTWKAREYSMHTRFIELAGEINASMPSYVVQHTMDALNEFGKSLKGSKILVLGIAYKKNVDDMRESPSVEIIHLLFSKGSFVSYSDPFFPVFPPMRKYSYSLASVELSADNIASFDAVIIATDHDVFDYQLIKDSSSLLIDCRGRFNPGGSIYRA